MTQAAVAAPSDLDGWSRAWMHSHRNPHLFACGVLGFIPYDPEAAKLTEAEFAAKYGRDAVMLEKWQDEFLRPENFFTNPNGQPTDNPRHSVTAGHGVGKGVVIAILALWFPLTHYDAKCVLTANSQDQLATNNWPEVKKWAQRLPPALRSQLQIDEERLYVKAAPEMAFVVRRTASKHNPEALQGVHAKHVLYLVDEASGVLDMIFEVAQGSLSTKGAIACLFSNPTRASGFFFQTHHTLRGTWRCRRVSCEDIPRAQGHIEDIIKAYGKESNRYRVRVLGLFPTKDDDTVIPLDLIEAAKARDVKPVAVFPVWGLDVSRFGDDRTVLVKRMGNVLLEPPIVWKNLNTQQIAGRVIDEYRNAPSDMKPMEICVDVIGWGAGVVDALDMNGSPFKGKTNGVNVAENAPNDTKYHRQRDALWFAGRQWFDAKDCSIPKVGCEELISELSAPTYDFTASGQTIVCSKKDMKKELGFSPDLADAFILTFAAGVYQREPDLHRQREAPRRRKDPWGA